MKAISRPLASPSEEHQSMDGFWENVLRYQRYFVTVLLGVVWNFVEPLVPLFKRPLSAIALIGLIVGLLTFVALTLRAMLGLTAA